MIDFFSNVVCVSMQDLSDEEKLRCSQFLPCHPKYRTHVCLMRNKAVLGNIDWSFFRDAKTLSRPLCHRSTVRQDPPTAEEEDKCRSILLLVCPFRSDSDLQHRNSYFKKFSIMHKRGDLVDKEYLLNNIQNIRNSLGTERMSDDTATESVDPEGMDGEEEDEESERLRNNLVSTLLKIDESGGLKEEPTEFTMEGDMNLPHRTIGEANVSEPVDAMPPESVFEFDSVKKAKRKLNYLNKCRYVSDPCPLNTMLQSNFIMRGENDDNPNRIRIKATGSVESIIRFGLARELDLDQQTAFEILTSTVVSSFVADSLEKVDSSDIATRDSLRTELEELRSLAQYKTRGERPLRMFLTGPAGAGKSTILDSLVDYCQEFCTSLGHIYDGGVIRLSALTGAAATEIRGQTTHTECRLNRSSITPEDILEWRNTRLLVIDEISFAGYKDILIKLSGKLQTLTEERNVLFGSVPIVFIGDFLQLEPIDEKDTIFKSESSLYWESELNVFTELKGKHRYKNCKVLQETFPKLRALGLTAEVRKIFNSRVVGTNGLGMPDILTTKVATHSNATKEKFNDSVFLEHLKRNHSKDPAAPVPWGTVVIKAKMSWSLSKRLLNFTERNAVFAGATEANTSVDKGNGENKKKTGKRVPPMLKLFHGCHVMTSENTDVENGIANGTTAQFEQLVLQEKAEPHKIRINGYYVWAVHVDEVDYIRLRWTEDSTFQGTFCVSPKNQTCKTSAKCPGETKPKEIRAIIRQFPISVNHATTGHKLQGKTLKGLLIAEWPKKHLKNWIYVVLSRVKKIDDLFLLHPIPDGEDDYPDPRLTDMLTRLRIKLQPLPGTVRATRARNQGLN